MALNYANLTSKPITEHLELLHNATADEIRALIKEAKDAQKPLLGLYINELMTAKHCQPEQTRACIKILLDQTQDNWDYEFPTKLTGYYASLYFLTYIQWTKADSKETIATFASIIYRLSPEVVIRGLEANTKLFGGVLVANKTLYTYLLENRPASNPILLAISAVLGQAETEEVKIFKNEINLALTQGPASKDHQVLLLKHFELFDDNTIGHLKDPKKLSMKEDEFHEYADMIEFKRSTVSGHPISPDAVGNLILQYSVFFRLLTIDPLSVEKNIRVFEDAEIARLIETMHDTHKPPATSYRHTNKPPCCSG